MLDPADCWAFGHHRFAALGLVGSELLSADQKQHDRRPGAGEVRTDHSQSITYRTSWTPCRCYLISDVENFERFSGFDLFMLLQTDQAHMQWKLRIARDKLGQSRVNSDGIIKASEGAVGVRQQQECWHQLGTLPGQLRHGIDDGGGVASSSSKIVLHDYSSLPSTLTAVMVNLWGSSPTRFQSNLRMASALASRCRLYDGRR